MTADFMTIFNKLYHQNLSFEEKTQFIYNSPQDYNLIMQLARTLAIFMTTNATDSLDIDLVLNAEEWILLLSKTIELLKKKKKII